jgi:hypothetical protein
MLGRPHLAENITGDRLSHRAIITRIKRAGMADH